MPVRASLSSAMSITLLMLALAIPDRAEAATAAGAVASPATGAVTAAATAAQREVHYQTVQALIEAEVRPTAERQLAAFAAAGYPDGEWQAKSLSWFYAARFKDGIGDPAKAEALAKEAAALRKELDGAIDAGKLPDAVKRLMDGAGSEVLDLAHRLGQKLNPYAPTPAAPMSADAAKPIADQLDALMKAVGKEWERGLQSITAAATAEKPLVGMEPEDSRFGRLIEDAINRRLAPVRSYYHAYLVLREVVARGKDLGLDPAPVEAFFETFSAANAATLQQWDELCGEYAPALRLYLATVQMESVRRELVEQTVEDLEGELRRIIDNPVDRMPASQRAAFVDLQLEAWAGLLRERIQTGSEDDVARGVEQFTLFQEIAAENPLFQVRKSEGARGRSIARVMILGARLLHASGDKAAATDVLAQVAGATGNAGAGEAAQWLAVFSRDGGVSYGSPMTAKDPIQAIVAGRALLKDARSSADPAVARSQALAAVVTLRSGVVGFAGAVDPVVLDRGPELHQLLAVAYARIGMRLHSALTTLDGVRAAANRITRDANPWRDATGWTKDGKILRDLAQQALDRAADVHANLNQKASQELLDEAVALFKRIDPEGAGDLDWLPIELAKRSGNWERASTLLDAYAKKHATEVADITRVLEARISIKLSAARSAKEGAPKDAAAKEVIAATDDAKRQADAALASTGLRDEDRRRWMRVLSAVESATVSLLMAESKYDEVLKRLDADYWTNPPGDDNLRAAMLGHLCTANGMVWKDKAKAEALDAPALTAAWRDLAAAYATCKRLIPSIKDPELQRRTLDAGRNLAAAAQRLVNRAEVLKAKTPALVEVVREGKRAMADLMEPTIDAKSTSKRPESTLQVAEILWQVDEHVRAVRLFELWKSTAATDEGLKAWQADPTGILDACHAATGDRPELLKFWDGRGGIRDLLEDQVGLQDLIRQGVTKDQWEEDPVDYPKAAERLRALRAELAGLKVRLGDEAWNTANDQFGKLDKIVGWLSASVAVDARLAMGYREMGKGEKARELYQQLYTYDPGNPVFAAAYIDITIEAVQQGKAEETAISQAAESAAKVRAAAGKDLDLYWLSSIQVWELRLAMGQSDLVIDELRFQTTSRNDPSRDLVGPAIRGDARQRGDDPRVRRARNALAVDLARRYLALCARPDVALPAPFTIQDVIDGERTWTIFLDPQVPAMVPVRTTNQDEVEVVLLLPPGTDPLLPAPPAGSATAAGTDTAAGTVTPAGSVTADATTKE